MAKKPQLIEFLSQKKSRYSIILINIICDYYIIFMRKFFSYDEDMLKQFRKDMERDILMRLNEEDE